MANHQKYFDDDTEARFEFLIEGTSFKSMLS
jgi:hypothetical protein